MTDERTIADNMALAAHLWPHYVWHAEMRDLWVNALKGLRQDLVAQAMRDIRADYTSREPEVKWIRARYGLLYGERHPVMPRTRENATHTWHVSWQRTSKHGVPGAWFGCRTDSRDDAERLAKMHGGRVANMDAESDQVTEHDLNCEQQAALEVIEALPREAVERALSRCRSAGFCKDKLPPRVREWPRMAVLAVHAAHMLPAKENGNGTKP